MQHGLQNQTFSKKDDGWSSHPSLIFAVAAEMTRRNGSYYFLLKLLHTNMLLKRCTMHPCPSEVGSGQGRKGVLAVVGWNDTLGQREAVWPGFLQVLWEVIGIKACIDDL